MLFQSGSRTTSKDKGLGAGSWEPGTSLANRGGHFRSKLLEVLLKQARELSSLDVVRRRVVPRSARIEDLVRHPRDVLRDLEPEHRLAPRGHGVELTAECRANHRARVLQVHPVSHAVRAA